MTSIIFPGQGSQFLGMSKDFYDNFQVARLTFEEIQDYTKTNLKNIIFGDNSNLLDLTENTQISIFTASMLIYKTLINETDINNSNINYMLGHSLGEYTALACSQKISLKDSSILLKKRGQLMGNAVEPNKTGMAALIGNDINFVKKIIENNKLNIEIANDNSPLQIVISGNINDIHQSEEIFLKNDIKKFVKLNVSAAFHSHFMIDAQKKLNDEINKINFTNNKINIISNYDANSSNDNEKILTSLKNQMANMVRWTESVQTLINLGETEVIEIGPGKVLSGLIKRISKNIDIKSISNISELGNFK